MMQQYTEISPQDFTDEQKVMFLKNAVGETPNLAQIYETLKASRQGISPNSGYATIPVKFNELCEALHAGAQAFDAQNGISSRPRRANIHDNSKLRSPEKELFDEFTPKLKGCTYGSDEYKDYLRELKTALDHHYVNNSHHPEHYMGGVNGMTLFDIVEMFFDWKAATERHADGDIYKSIEVNKGRFGLSDQICEILTNTAKALGY